MPVSVTLALSESEGNVGEPLRSQIVVQSNARKGSAPITLSSLLFQFKGGLSEVQLTHQSDDNTPEIGSGLFEVPLQESTSATEKPRWTGAADLTIGPGEAKVYNFPLVFREAGDVEVLPASSRFRLSALVLSARTHRYPVRHSRRGGSNQGLVSSRGK
jgi:hypothetical protein